LLFYEEEKSITNLQFKIKLFNTELLIFSLFLHSGEIIPTKQK